MEADCLNETNFAESKEAKILQRDRNKMSPLGSSDMSLLTKDNTSMRCSFMSRRVKKIKKKVFSPYGFPDLKKQVVVRNFKFRMDDYLNKGASIRNMRATQYRMSISESIKKIKRGKTH